ncbi:MAG: serine hydroxymethyltransferase [Oscillospiraceae bacterium]|nr:serine hydroxymethyltransferase [Oscillospiraceae bacterium]
MGDFVYKFDEDLGGIINKELKRQQNNLELIASENFISEAIMATTSSVFTNKYAEGYPGKRYYGGCEFADQVENLAIDRACELFSAEHANVQPHSGASANLAAYFSLLKPGDTVFGMNLTSGGHLTHGSPVNISGKYYKFVSYDVDKDTQLIDYNELYEKAIKIRPKLIVCGASAYPRFIDFKKFREIADACGAYLMTDMAHIAGLVAAGIHPSPIPYSDVVTSTTHKTLRGPRAGLILCKEKFAKAIDSAIFPGTQGGPLMHVIAAKAICFKEAMTDEFVEYSKKTVKNCSDLADAILKKGLNLVSQGTDNHLLLINLEKDRITGKELQLRLEKLNITVNKNTIPGEKLDPFTTSGIRIGTSAVTTRGLGGEEMKQIAEFIHLAIYDFEDSKSRILREVKEICENFPLYKH